MNLLTLLKGKLALTAMASVLLLGGATAVFAATPVGRSVVQSLAHPTSTAAASATKSAQDSSQGKAGTHNQNQDRNTCPGLSDAQNLAQTYGLSDTSTSAGVMAICALHQGTFKGTTTDGVAVNSTRVYGYGEIDQLLTYARYLATQDKTSTDGKLNDTNVSGYLAAAMHSCGTMPLAECLTTHIPNYQAGGHNGNKPGATPTPNGNKPVATPTPHH